MSGRQSCHYTGPCSLKVYNSLSPVYSGAASPKYMRRIRAGTRPEYMRLVMGSALWRVWEQSWGQRLLELCTLCCSALDLKLFTCCVTFDPVLFGFGLNLTIDPMLFSFGYNVVYLLFNCWPNVVQL